MLEKKTVLVAGVGFLATHLVPHLLPHANLVLLDRDSVEQGNYDNAIFPKHYIGRWKVSAVASLVQLLSATRTAVVHKNVKTVEQLQLICTEHNVEFMVVTFDNPEARLIARDCAITYNIPTLFIGVTEGFIYIDWAESVVLPETPEELEVVKAEIARVHDVCTRLEFRPLGALAAGYAYYAFTQWLTTGERNMFNIGVGATIRVANLKRGGFSNG
jgi:hypothetical protein